MAEDLDDYRRIFDGGTTLATNGALHETVRSLLQNPEGGQA